MTEKWQYNNGVKEGHIDKGKPQKKVIFLMAVLYLYNLLKNFQLSLSSRGGGMGKALMALQDNNFFLLLPKSIIGKLSEDKLRPLKWTEKYEIREKRVVCAWGGGCSTTGLVV